MIRNTAAAPQLVGAEQAQAATIKARNEGGRERERRPMYTPFHSLKESGKGCE